jgi:Helix-hairpin-helix motif
VTHRSRQASRLDWPRILRILARVGFVAVPALSFGYLTGMAFLFAAVQLRSRRLAVAAAVYLTATVVTFSLSQREMTVTLSVVLSVHAGLNWLVGTAHAVVVQRRLFRPVPSAMEDPAVIAALARRKRREEARELLDRDPALAAELRIGRPDLPRDFDDGGLIDINTVSAQVLSRLPGLRPEDVERILTARLDPLGLHSVEDLIVSAEVPADVAESLREQLVFSSSTKPL